MLCSLDEEFGVVVARATVRRAAVVARGTLGEVELAGIAGLWDTSRRSASTRPMASLLVAGVVSRLGIGRDRLELREAVQVRVVVQVESRRFANRRSLDLRCRSEVRPMNCTRWRARPRDGSSLSDCSKEQRR